MINYIFIVFKLNEKLIFYNSEKYFIYLLTQIRIKMEIKGYKSIKKLKCNQEITLELIESNFSNLKI